MKKIVMLLVVLMIFSLTACNTENENNMNENNSNESSSNENSTNENESNENSIEESDWVIKDINTIEVPALQLDNTLEYIEPLKDENGELYVKISDTYLVDNVTQDNKYKIYFYENEREILPSKVYAMDDTRTFIYTYNGKKYYVPVEKCEYNEERVVYRDYDIEIMRHTGEANIFGDTFKIFQEDYFSGISVDDADIFDIFNTDIYSERRIYELDIDNNLDTKEVSLCQYSYNSGDGYAWRKHLITKDENNIVNIYGASRIGGNIKGYKNVFYAYNAFYGINDVANENILLGYYLYDKEDGLKFIYGRLANGEKFENVPEDAFKGYELTLAVDVAFSTVKNNEMGIYIDYSTWFGDFDNKVVLPKGTKLKLIEVDEYSNAIAETEDGTIYQIASYSGLT